MTQYSDATLLSWLAAKPVKLERHLDKHPEDIIRLERLTALEDRQVAAISQTVVPPAEFADQVISRISIDPRLRDAGSMFAEMFTLGFRTLQVVFNTSDGDPAEDLDGAGAGQALDDPGIPGQTEGHQG